MNYKGENLYWIAICDDERKSVEEIRNLLLEEERKPGDFMISVFSSGEDLLKVDVSRYHLLILDMIFPGKSGREIASEYRNRNKDGLLVFCTGKSSPIPEDFKMLPYRYARKEHIRQLRSDFQDAVDEMYRREAKEYLKLTLGKTTRLFNVEDILYFEIAKNGSIVYFFDNQGKLSKIKVRERVKEIYSQISIFGFEFSHNSFLVNCHYVKCWNSHELEFFNGGTLNVSRAREKKFKEACMKCIA